MSDYYTDVVDYRLWSKRFFFVVKAHVLTLLVMAFTALHVYDFVRRQRNLQFEFKRSVIVHRNYELLYFIGFSFWGFLYMVFFHKSMAGFRWWINFFIVTLMAWSSFPLIMLSLFSARISEWFDAAYATMVLMALHTLLASFRKPFYQFSSLFLMKWSIRGFIFSSLGILLSIAWKKSHVDVIVAYFLLLFYFVLTILFGRTLGSEEFYVKEIESSEWFFIILIHYNFMSIYAIIMLAMCKTRCVLSESYEG